jgi:hypothetical protein
MSMDGIEMSSPSQRLCRVLYVRVRMYVHGCISFIYMDRINHLAITRYFVSKNFINILINHWRFFFLKKNHSRFVVNRNGFLQTVPCPIPIHNPNPHVHTYNDPIPCIFGPPPFMFAPFSAEMHVLVRIRH